MEPRATYPPGQERADRSMGDLIRELRDETSTLFRQEIALAKEEMSEKLKIGARNTAYMAIGGLVAYAGFLLFLFALGALAVAGFRAAGMSPGLAMWLGPALVGLIVAGIGYALIKKAMTAFSTESLTPTKTVESLEEDKEWIQQKINRE